MNSMRLINRLRGMLATPAPFEEVLTEDGFLLWPAMAEGSPERVRLADGERVISNVHRPTLRYYPAEKPTGAAVIIAPGGSHRELWIDHEGHRPAQWLSERGIAAFVLKYRLAAEAGSPYSVEPHALADILRGVRYVRSRAEEWGIDAGRVGVMGFSAGGELAALAAMRYDAPPLMVGDVVDQKPSKPDFQVLVYPSYPDRFVVTKQSPPAFICGGYQDCADITSECAKLFVRFKEKGVPAELHLYAHVGHGFGFRAGNKGSIAEWPQRLYDWLSDSGLLRR